MKMKTNYRLQMIALVLTGSMIMYSCKKEKSESPATDTETMVAASADESALETTFNDIFDDAAGIDDGTAGDDLGIYGSSGGGVFARTMNGETSRTAQRCFTVAVTPRDRGVFPKTVTIDFGSGCETRGHLRKGKIIIVYSGRLHIPGNSAVTTFENYSVDSFSIQGKHTLQNVTDPGSNVKKFSTKIENARITNTLSGRWRSWNSARLFIQTEGNGTPFFPVDDVFHVTGNANGENSNGRSWASEIIEPLVKKFTCRWFSKGVAEIRVNSTVGKLDFGDGTCDNQATLTVNGDIRTITLR